MSCEYKYTVSMNNLQWYRQYPNTKLEFLVLIMESGQNQTATSPHPRLTASVDKDKKLVNLEIFPADVKDSALYFCALQPTVTKKTHAHHTKTYLYISKPSAQRVCKRASRGQHFSLTGSKACSQVDMT